MRDGDPSSRMDRHHTTFLLTAAIRFSRARSCVPLVASGIAERTFGRARASSVLLSLNHNLLSIHNVQTLLKSSYMRWSQISDFDYYSEMIQIIMNKPYCNFEGQDQILRPFYVFLL